MILQGAYRPSTPHWTHKTFKSHFGGPLAPDRTTYLEGPGSPDAALWLLHRSVLVPSQCPPDVKVLPTMESSSERLQHHVLQDPEQPELKSPKQTYSGFTHFSHLLVYLLIHRHGVQVPRRIRGGQRNT